MAVSGNAKMAGVIGWPVKHSRSPQLHGYWLDKYGIDGVYVPLAIQEEDLASCLRALSKMGFVGCNVTVPHKEAVLELADDVDDVARRIGAANTLVFRDNKILATNTDGFGFYENLRQSVNGWSANGIRAVVLGAGGASRAICATLAEQGAQEVIVLNRTRTRAETMVSELNGPFRVIDWDQRNAALDGTDLLVNTTTLGMAGQRPLEIDLATLPKTAVVTDIVYTPLETSLLEAARLQGNPVVDGLGMLLYQAVPGFEAWFGIRPEVTQELREAVLAIR